MFLQNGMPNRRQFLERSALGAGSVLFSSLLVGSCTDHLSPTPLVPPIIPPVIPPGAGFNIDWNDAAKSVVIAGLGMIPEVGEILGSLLDILWPSTKEDVWGEIKGHVEALVDQKIAAAVYQRVTEDLKGLNNSLILYLNELKNGNQTDIRTQWLITKNLFVNALPHFQSAGNELPLLPLFAQFANMYLAILRDGVAFGASWGRSDADRQQDVRDLKQAILDFTAYANKTYSAGLTNVQQKTNSNRKLVEPFRSVNKYVREMTLSVLDFMHTWPYYDVTLYPTGTKVVFTREVYSDPYGTTDNSHPDAPLALRKPEPTQFPTQLIVWGWDLIDAAMVTYPAGSGPGGVTQTPRMGNANGGSNQPPHGNIFNISPGNPIVQARATYGDIVNSMQFKFHDGAISNVLGGRVKSGSNDTGLMGFANHALSSLHIHGYSDAYGGAADCVVFGFKYWTSPADTFNAIRALYIRGPKERSLADVAQVFTNLTVPANLITEELKTARQAYWAYIAARAKALK